MPTIIKSSYVYVDANYVRCELRNAGQPEDFNPGHLWEALSMRSTTNQIIYPSRMFFYDAIDEGASDQEMKARQAYLGRVEQINYISVVTGFVRPGKKQRRQQKGVDVQIAVDALEAAWSGRTEAIVLVAGDADFCPLADAVRRAGPFMIVFGFQNSMSSELRHSADVAAYLHDLKDGYLKPFSS